MDSNALIHSGVRVKEWQKLLTRHARIARWTTERSLRSLHIHTFAWGGSVEPCTGVLCKTCQRSLRDFLILKARKGTHHATASSMLAAVEIGCRVCTCLWRAFAGKRVVDLKNSPKDKIEQSHPFSSFESLSPTSKLPHTVFTVGLFKVGFTISHWTLELWAEQKKMVPTVHLFPYSNDRIGLMNHYWKLAKGWLSECLSHHIRCKHVIGAQNYYPTRLIEVRPNSSDCELRLYLTSYGSIKEPYMTLSHCWGKSQFLRLTTSTQDRLQKGFILADLPPTFQDAIMVTRALGINFLWIDALCIIQDSLVDWQHEATLMSQVYSNSICNVSALDAHDSSEGLFFDRENSNVPYCTFTTRRRFNRKRLYEFAYAGFWCDSVQHAPLTRRAWVFQERLLAPRVLHFGKRQLLWECNKLRACEVYPRGMPYDGYAGDWFLKKSFATILQEGLDNALDSIQIYKAWFDIVEAYTACNLTKSADKLVAISGIVKHLQPLFKTDYLAGLWRDDLLRQMLWRVEHYEARRFLAAKKRPEYRAPSWSWASIDEQIEIWMGRDPIVMHIATIIEARVTPVTDDNTGQIVNGYIRLQAPLFPVQLLMEYTFTNERALILDWEWGRRESSNAITPDVWPQSAVERLGKHPWTTDFVPQSAVEELQFVPLSMMSYLPHSDWPDADIRGLLLKPVEGKQGEYQRWGHVICFERHEKFLDFGIQLINGKWTYNPPEKYPEQIITLI